MTTIPLHEVNGAPCPFSGGQNALGACPMAHSGGPAKAPGVAVQPRKRLARAPLPWETPAVDLWATIDPNQTDIR